MCFLLKKNKKKNQKPKLEINQVKPVFFKYRFPIILCCCNSSFLFFCLFVFIMGITVPDSPLPQQRILKIYIGDKVQGLVYWYLSVILQHWIRHINSWALIYMKQKIFFLRNQQQIPIKENRIPVRVSFNGCMYLDSLFSILHLKIKFLATTE